MYYGEDFEGKRQYDILGSDGTYLYLYRITTEIPLELEDDDNVRVDQCINTVYIYRVGADWKPVKVFSDVNLHLGSGRILAEDDWLGLDWADENYLSILYGDEDVQTFVIDREGNFLFSMQYFINEDDYPDYFEADENGNQSYFEVDESMVRVRIFDGRAYVIECDGGGYIGAVKIIPLDEAVKNENERKAASAKRGDKVRSRDGNFLYEITSTGKEKTCALIWWQDDFYGDADAQKNGLKYIIPETIQYGTDDYTVNEIRTAYGALDAMWVDEIEFPATIRKTNLRYCLFELDGFNPRPGVKITFKCDPSVFTELKKITVSSNAIESIIYVPEEYLEGYRELLKDKTACDFSDNDIESRVYTGIPVTYIGDEDILPEGFVNDGSFYRILDSKKRTVSLLTTYKIMGLGENSYTQPGEVMYRGEKYTVTGIEYYAFCNVHYKDRIELKLPSTVASIESRSIGWTVTKLDLSETKIKEIPEFLVNSDYDEYDEPTVITEIILPKKCKKIADQAFYNCEGLKSITLPKGITIGTDALPEGCKTIYY
ncbi:MAG: leucine-rich repeat protein [Lachnospiraceae bacterium]|nr:leucine-rich repeat protein [Lachnospiraceae bacterium]